MKKTPVDSVMNLNGRRNKENRTEYPIPYSEPVVVRPKYGQQMEGIEIHKNGIAFRSPYSLRKGHVMELVLCRGSILIDAEVVHCAAVEGETGAYAIRASYLHVSEELIEFIAEEVQQSN